MEGTCPRCQARLELPASGLYECERCKARFEVALGAPAPPAPPAPAVASPFGAYLPGPQAPPFAAAPVLSPSMPPPLDPSSHAPCATHPGNLAERVCERCGDFMCRLCATPVEGRQYCPKCFDLLYHRGALQFAQRQFTLPGVCLALGITAILCAIFCFFCFPIGLVLGIGGVATGLRAVKEHRERPDLPNRGLTLTGVGLSAAAIVLSVVIGVGFIWLTMQN